MSYYREPEQLDLTIFPYVGEWARIWDAKSWTIRGTLIRNSEQVNVRLSGDWWVSKDEPVYIISNGPWGGDFKYPWWESQSLVYSPKQNKFGFITTAWLETPLTWLPSRPFS